MIINGCIATGDADCIDEEVLKEIFKELGFEDEVEHEDLAIVSGTYKVYNIHGSDSDFTIVTKDEEYRVIHEDVVDDIFRQEAEDFFDEDQWREEVSNYNTEEGFCDWQNDQLDNGDYASFFSRYDSREKCIGDYLVYRLG